MQTTVKEVWATWVTAHSEDTREDKLKKHASRHNDIAAATSWRFGTTRLCGRQQLQVSRRDPGMLRQVTHVLRPPQEGAPRRSRDAHLRRRQVFHVPWGFSILHRQFSALLQSPRMSAWNGCGLSGRFIRAVAAGVVGSLSGQVSPLL